MKSPLSWRLKRLAADAVLSSLLLLASATEFSRASQTFTTTYPSPIGTYKDLDVSGTLRTTSFQLTNGAGAGRILTSDASGFGTWTNAGNPFSPRNCYWTDPPKCFNTGMTITCVEGEYAAGLRTVGKTCPGADNNYGFEVYCCKPQ